MHDICKSSAARGKAAHRGTTSKPGAQAASAVLSSTTSTTTSSSTGLLGPPSSTVTSSTDRLVPSSTSSTAFTHNLNAFPEDQEDPDTSTFHDREFSESSSIPHFFTLPMLLTGPPPNPRDISMTLPLIAQVAGVTGVTAPSDTSAPPSSFSQPLSVPSATAVDSNPLPKKSVKSTRTTSSNKRRRDALDDGNEARSTARSSFVSSEVPTPGISTLKGSNAASMITLAGAVASLGTSINHQTMTSDHHIADKVQGYINSQKYLSDLEKSLAGEYYATQTTLASGLMSMAPTVAKLTLRRKVKALAKDVELEGDMEDMSVSSD
jgi:hypothetical protein